MPEMVPQRLREQAFERIREMIRSGELKPGELLPGENRLAELLGVSRVTVRWALKQLAETGIIRTRKGKGSVVAVDWKSLLEQGELHDQAEEYQTVFFQSTQARRLMEPVVARRSAVCATEEDLARMELSLQNDAEEFVFSPVMGKITRQVDFHTCIWMSLHNSILMEVWKGLSEASGRINRLPFVAPTHRNRQKLEAQRQHRRILEAIRNRQEEYAYFYMLEHCDWITETYGEYFQDFLK